MVHQLSFQNTFWYSWPLHCSVVYVFSMIDLSAESFKDWVKMSTPYSLSFSNLINSTYISNLKTRLPNSGIHCDLSRKECITLSLKCDDWYLGQISPNIENGTSFLSSFYKSKNCCSVLQKYLEFSLVICSPKHHIFYSVNSRS